MKIVICSVDQMGTLGQCLGVANQIARFNALSQIPTRIVRSSIYGSLLARVTPPSFRNADIVLSCGAAGERRARRLLRSRQSAFWAHIEVPNQSRSDGPDLAFVSNHDWKPEYEARLAYRRMHGVPHRLTYEDLSAVRRGARERLGIGDNKVVAVLIGGPNPAFSYNDEVVARLTTTILANAANSKVLTTASRRSAPLMVRALGDLRHTNVHVLTGESSFSYLEMLAAADAVLVTEDSITMTCEALTTRQPVRLLGLAPVPGERLQKFRRFQTHFIDELGILRFYDGSLPEEGAVEGNPLNDTADVANQILEQLSR